MKKFLFLSVFSLVVLFTNAQLRKIPADVTDAFTSRYPHAKRVEWKDKLHNFEVSFELNSCNITATFSPKGEWEGSERELKFDQLPSEVKDGFLKSKYAERQRNNVYEIQELGQPLQYRINVQKSGIQKKNLVFDVNGRLLKENIVL